MTGTTIAERVASLEEKFIALTGRMDRQAELDAGVHDRLLILIEKQDDRLDTEQSSRHSIEKRIAYAAGAIAVLFVLVSWIAPVVVSFLRGALT